MQVEMITIGDELLLGYTVDTNAAFFARLAAEQGIRVVRRTTVGDNASEIAEVVREALWRTGGVITSGGLGPTSDDLTKPAIAELFGRGMTFDESILENLKKMWKARGLKGELPKSNQSQAMIPSGARILENRHGSAPGIWLEDSSGRWVAMLPGVPREFRGMTEDVLIPSLAARGGSGRVIRSRTIRTTGVAESALADVIGELDENPVSLAFLPGWEGVDLRLTVYDQPPDVATELLARSGESLLLRVNRWVYGEGHDDLAEKVLGILRRRNLTLAVAESCTGGMLGMRLTSVPGASDVVEGGVIAYSNGIKVAMLGVREVTLERFGAVSEEVAAEMASGVRARYSTGVGLAITGVAGPGGGTPEKPVGTVCIAVDIEGEVVTRRYSLIGDRREIRQRSTQAVLGILFDRLTR